MYTVKWTRISDCSDCVSATRSGARVHQNNDRKGFRQREKASSVAARRSSSRCRLSHARTATLTNLDVPRTYLIVRDVGHRRKRRSVASKYFEENETPSTNESAMVVGRRKNRYHSANRRFSRRVRGGLGKFYASNYEILSAFLFTIDSGV